MKSHEIQCKFHQNNPRESHEILTFHQAGVLETLVSALRINRNDPESLRCLAAALGSLVDLDFGTVRLSAVKVDDGMMGWV